MKYEFVYLCCLILLGVRIRLTVSCFSPCHSTEILLDKRIVRYSEDSHFYSYFLVRLGSHVLWLTLYITQSTSTMHVWTKQSSCIYLSRTAQDELKKVSASSCMWNLFSDQIAQTFSGVKIYDVLVKPCGNQADDGFVSFYMQLVCFFRRYFVHSAFTLSDSADICIANMCEPQ